MVNGDKCWFIEGEIVIEGEVVCSSNDMCRIKITNNQEMDKERKDLFVSKEEAQCHISKSISNFLITLFIDFLYLVAGATSLAYYKTGDYIIFANAVAAYAFMAILFQILSHIVEKIICHRQYTIIRVIIVIILSFVLAYSITCSLIEIPDPMIIV